MPSWTVGTPVNMDFDDVTELNVRLIGGTVAVLATGDRPSLTVSEIKGRPLRVEHSGGRLMVSYEALTWERLLDFLRPLSDRAAVTITVPAGCPIQLGVVSASALVSGLTAGASVKGVSGDVTLDGLAGDVLANTVSGELLARDLDGTVSFASVSGSLALADCAIGSLAAESVNGQVTADIALDSAGSVQVSTVSGEVTLRMPFDTDAEVRLASLSGKIRSEFDSLQPKKAPGARIVSGNVGAGTGQVAVNTVSGAITLLRRSDRRASPRAEPPLAQAGTESETR
ncbi:MAG: DUF4097 family beta strand repeat protein [Nocardiopsaceae bacterium]|nr:DUF4097 family beta strand repeat protein [Nocardiopsaceae bacterium]